MQSIGTCNLIPGDQIMHSSEIRFKFIKLWLFARHMTSSESLQINSDETRHDLLNSPVSATLQHSLISASDDAWCSDWNSEWLLRSFGFAYASQSCCKPQKCFGRFLIKFMCNFAGATHEFIWLNSPESLDSTEAVVMEKRSFFLVPVKIMKNLITLNRRCTLDRR